MLTVFGVFIFTMKKTVTYSGEEFFIVKDFFASLYNKKGNRLHSTNRDLSLKYHNCVYFTISLAHILYPDIASGK